MVETAGLKQALHLMNAVLRFASMFDKEAEGVGELLPPSTWPASSLGTFLWRVSLHDRVAHALLIML